MNFYTLKKSEWDNQLERLLSSYYMYASINNEFGQDYELVKPFNIQDILYNKPKPTTPLKGFFLPVKENVTTDQTIEKQRVIIGVPNCDIEGLKILDEIYLDKDFIDTYYKKRRESTILISTDCFSKQEHCHCSAYGISPFARKTADVSLALLNSTIILNVLSEKGESFCKTLSLSPSKPDDILFAQIENKHNEIETQLKVINKDLPDYQRTGNLIAQSNEETWEKFSNKCVSCGACATICPTCSCFLLIDKPDFEKVKQLDACQYPGFERVAGGEDALHKLYARFRHRYYCKYVWKPEKFSSIACTGCGRCIETCLGRINKNELFMELAK